MPNENDVEGLRQELTRLRKLPDYSTLRPFLDRLEPFLNISGKAGVVEKGLELAGALTQKGVQSRSDMHDLASNFVHNEIQAEKVVNFNGNVEFKGDLKLQGDILLKLFTDALKEIKVADPGIEINFVIVAMTGAEAQALDQKSAFSGNFLTLRNDFEQLATYLANNRHVDWAANYGNNAEAWRPRGGKSIADYVNEALTMLNEDREPASKKLIPKLYDIHSLDVQGRNVLRRLRNLGCIVIVDAISLRHPAVIQSFQRSLLDVFPSTSVFVVTPDDNVLQMMSGMVYALQSSFQESEFGIRLKDPLDGLSCTSGSNVDNTFKWIIERVRNISSSLISRDNGRSQIQF